MVHLKRWGDFAGFAAVSTAGLAGVGAGDHAGSLDLVRVRTVGERAGTRPAPYS